METEINVPTPVPAKHQLAKLVLGTAAGFLAGKVVEAIYDGTLERLKKNQENTPE